MDARSFLLCEAPARRPLDAFVDVLYRPSPERPELEAVEEFLVIRREFSTRAVLQHDVCVLASAGSREAVHEGESVRRGGRCSLAYLVQVDDVPQSRVHIVGGRQLGLVVLGVRCHRCILRRELVGDKEEESREFRFQPARLGILVELAVPNSMIPAQDYKNLPKHGYPQQGPQEVSQLYVDLPCSQHRRLVRVHHRQIHHLGYVAVAAPELLHVIREDAEDRLPPEAKPLRGCTEGVELRFRAPLQHLVKDGVDRVVGHLLRYHPRSLYGRLRHLCMLECLEADPRERGLAPHVLSIEKRRHVPVSSRLFKNPLLRPVRVPIQPVLQVAVLLSCKVRRDVVVSAAAHHIESLVVIHLELIPDPGLVSFLQEVEGNWQTSQSLLARERVHHDEQDVGLFMVLLEFRCTIPSSFPQVLLDLLGSLVLLMIENRVHQQGHCLIPFLLTAENPAVTRHQHLLLHHDTSELEGGLVEVVELQSPLAACSFHRDKELLVF
mmetsp:Transcript_3193/g.10796  ORF Transcript_3193/g.10796 Transcript_3193/m.10796 type:complete len:495 (+) Transcript_3193:687-2171(+)